MSALAVPKRGRKVLVWVFRRAPDGVRVLLLQRAPPWAPDWHPVTGHVDDGEDLEAAARREALEETGCDGRVLDLDHEYVFSGTWQGEEYEYHERAFGLESHTYACALSHEHQAHKWVTPDEASALVVFDEHREALRRLTARLAV